MNLFFIIVGITLAIVSGMSFYEIISHLDKWAYSPVTLATVVILLIYCFICGAMMVLVPITVGIDDCIKS